jgi:hypothetical protein
LSFTPKNQEWPALMDEVSDLLRTVGESSAPELSARAAVSTPI